MPIELDDYFSIELADYDQKRVPRPSCSTEESLYRAGYGWSVRPQLVWVGHSPRRRDSSTPPPTASV